MALTLEYLNNERAKLQGDFDTISGNIEKTKKSLTTQQNNLNAVYGAIQQIDKMIPLLDKDSKEKQLLTEKDKVLINSLV